MTTPGDGGQNMAKAKDGILLESGTDEVEILEFVLGNQGFGVNVLKIQAIEQYDPERVTELPLGNPSIAGMFLFRNRTIPLIDLGVELGMRSPWAMEEPQEGADVEPEKRIVLITQFNRMTNAFLVDGVRRIHRVMWEDICPLSPVLTEHSSEFTGSLSIEDHEVLIVDMEKISGDFFESKDLLDLGDGEVLHHPREQERPSIKIMMVEDSSTTRAFISGVLEKGNYTNLLVFDNGREAHKAIEKMKADADEQGKDITEFVNLVITDIEMPQMDGLTLCHHIKFALGLEDLPVILYSSLLKDRMTQRAKDVKATAYITKPQCVKLVEMVDCLCIDKTEPPIRFQ